MTPAINDFVRLDGSTDLNAWRYDIIARLLADMDSQGMGFSTNEFCQIYFGSVDLEKKLWVGDQLQAVREMLQLRPIPLLLRNNQRRWYIVHPNDAGGARGFIQERAKRFIRAHQRLLAYSDISKGTYSLSEDDTLLRAIEGASTNVQQLEDVVDQEVAPSPSLPAPEEEYADIDLDDLDFDEEYHPDEDKED